MLNCTDLECILHHHHYYAHLHHLKHGTHVEEAMSTENDGIINDASIQSLLNDTEMAENEDSGLGHDQPDALDETNGIHDNLLNETDGAGPGPEDPELEAIKARVREMEEETKKLDQLKSDVDKQLVLGSPTSPLNMSLEEKMEADNRSLYVGNVDYGATAEELEQHFHGHPKGFAYIEFGDKDSVQTAMAMDESEFCGRQIKVMPKRTNRPGILTTNRPPRGRGSFRSRGVNRDSELSGLSHLDAPNESLYMIGGVCFAMFLVGVIIVLLAVTISKLRKREEHSNSVHPADVVLQTTPVNNTVITHTTSQVLQQDPLSNTGHILWQYPPPPPQPYLYNNDQDNLVQNMTEEHQGFARGFRKNLGGHWRRLTKRKSPAEVYTIPAELKPQLKQIYVY